MTTNAALKGHSRSLVASNYGFLVCAALVYGALTAVLLTLGDLISVPSQRSVLSLVLNILISLILFAFLIILETGFCFLSLNITRTGSAKMRDLFLGFRYHTGRLILLSALLAAIRYVCALPLIYAGAEFFLHGVRFRLFGIRVQSVPGAVLAIAVCAILTLILYIAVYLLFDQALYVFADRQDFGALRCMKESCLLMKRNRWKLFVLKISFAGYALLILLSFGIASICVKPYIDVTRAAFYVELSGRRTPYGD